MNRGTVIEFFVDEFLESLNMLWRHVGVELDHDAAIVAGIDDRGLSIGHRLDSALYVRGGRDLTCRSLVRVRV
jgi:hypothetical protein